MQKHKTGQLIMNNVILERQEYATIFILLKHAKSIELIPPSLTPKSKTPDFIMDGIAWEAKSPQGKNLITIERALHRAARQSRNIVLDLRRMLLSDDKMTAYVQKQFTLSRSIKRLKVILKSNQIIDFHK